jgi:hypothetical protein
MRLEGVGLHKITKQVNLSLSTIKNYLQDNAYGGKYKKTDWKTIGAEIKEIERKRVARNKDRGITIKTPKEIDLTEYRYRADEILDSVCRGYFPYPPIPEDITDAERRALQTDRIARVRGKGKKGWGHRWSRVPNHTAFPYNFVEPDPNYIPPEPEEEEKELTREEVLEQMRLEEERRELRKKKEKEDKEVDELYNDKEIQKMLGWYIEEHEIV